MMTNNIILEIYIINKKCMLIIILNRLILNDYIEKKTLMNDYIEKINDCICRISLFSSNLYVTL